MDIVGETLSYSTWVIYVPSIRNRARRWIGDLHAA